MKFIITAGGQGTKFWPYSREAKPKQFQPILGNKSLFSYTVETLLKAYPAEDIYVSTKKRYLGISVEQAGQIPIRNFILEPDLAKNRGPGEGFAFLKISMEHQSEPFMIVQSDCIRSPEDKYLTMISQMEKMVRKTRKMITGGVKATYPILGIDYLRLGMKAHSESGIEFYEIEEFIERPNDYHKTKQLLENFHVVTHSNHVCWFGDMMLDSYKKHRPDWYEKLMEIQKAFGGKDEEKHIEEIYAQMDPGATEEVTKHNMKEGFAVLLPFRWTDFGTWDSMYEYYANGEELFLDGNIIAIDTKKALVKSNNPKKLVAVLGLENIVVVDTEDILFIARKDKAGDIKRIHEEIKRKKLEEYL